MTQAEQQKAAKQFAEYWKDRGDEKQETQRYWIGLLGDVLGIANATNYIEFEKKVKLKHTSFIDAYISDTKVLIEQKGSKIDLTKPQEQSDGAILTPFGQAKRYADELPYDLRPRWIVVSNFTEIHIHDMNNPHAEPEIIKLENLEKEYYRLQFLVDEKNEKIRREEEISLQAGILVGKLYDALIKEYINPDESSLRSLNILCVRLVFCLYAEDAGFFENRTCFEDYVKSFNLPDLREGLIKLFKGLDTKLENRDKYDLKLKPFPYVNGGLFAAEDIEIPNFTQEIVDVLVNDCATFDWREISPTIFGAVFESTLNPETRRTGGMHYTSIENIHKVIDPLFLNELKEEFENIKELKQEKTRETKLIDFQKKLGSLKFLDPACGSGNFLTETYLSLRRLENEILKQLFKGGQMLIGFHDDWKPIEVSIEQFYGIEINDFASVVAKTALWIAESQMMKETEKLVEKQLNFLPLKSYANIVEGNALRIDWETVVPKNELNYIMGNPPFVGYDFMNTSQKEDMQTYFGFKTGRLDYVTAWYIKSAQFIKESKIACSFVSTNSITQGVQVPDLWIPMIRKYNVHINFAYKTFIWNSEASLKAQVHCVIIGFSSLVSQKNKLLFDESGTKKIVSNINPYLIESEDIIVEKRSSALCDVSNLILGNMPKDGGGFVLTPEEKKEFIKNEPLSEQWIKPYIGAVEFINNKQRYCLWLPKANPSELKKCPMVMSRIQQVKEFRLASKAPSTRFFAETPTLFCQIAQPESDFIIVPKTSSGRRQYVPIGFATKDIIVSDLVFIIPNANIYEFGILSSCVHNSWVRVVGGRLKSDYRYSRDIVYNTFPWPTPTDEQKAKIEKTAQAILDVRAKYPDCSLADLYDELSMPPDLRKAHQENDKAVMQAYGFSIKMTESECVAELFKMYEKLTAGK